MYLPYMYTYGTYTHTYLDGQLHTYKHIDESRDVNLYLYFYSSVEATNKKRQSFKILELLDGNFLLQIT